MSDRIRSVCRNRSNATDVMNVKEAADFLHCSFPFMKKLLDEGKIPHQKIGRKYFVGKESLQKWVNCSK